MSTRIWPHRSVCQCLSSHLHSALTTNIELSPTSRFFSTLLCLDLPCSIFAQRKARSYLLLVVCQAALEMEGLGCALSIARCSLATPPWQCILQPPVHCGNQDCQTCQDGSNRLSPDLQSSLHFADKGAKLLMRTNVNLCQNSVHRVSISKLHRERRFIIQLAVKVIMLISFVIT